MRMFFKVGDCLKSSRAGICRSGALLAFVGVFMLCGTAGAQSRISSVQILSAATATGAGDVHQPICTDRTFHAYGATTAGAGSATIVIEGSDITSPATGTRVDWVELGTITLTLSTTRTSAGFASQARWRHVRAFVSAISGTGASVNAFMGC